MSATRSLYLALLLAAAAAYNDAKTSQFYIIHSSLIYFIAYSHLSLSPSKSSSKLWSTTLCVQFICIFICIQRKPVIFKECCETLFTLKPLGMGLVGGGGEKKLYASQETFECLQQIYTLVKD